MMGRRTSIEAFKRDNELVDIIFNHKGKGNAIGTKELVSLLNERGYTVKPDQVHSIVGHIVANRHIPICSVTNCGYYWATSQQDIQSAIDDLQEKANGLQERIDFLKSFIYER